MTLYVRLNSGLDEVLQGPQTCPRNYDNVSRFDLLSDSRKADYLWFLYEESIPELNDFETAIFSSWDFGYLPTKVIGIYTKQTKEDSEIRTKQFEGIVLDSVDLNCLIIDIWDKIISATTLSDDNLRPVNKRWIQKLRKGFNEIKRLNLDKSRELEI